MVKLKFIWYDMWVGAYYDSAKKKLYLCPLPCVVIIIGGMNYLGKAKRSERAVCKCITLANRMTQRDLRQMKDYYASLEVFAYD